MSYRYSEGPATATAGLSVNAPVSREDFDEVVPKLREFIDTYRTIRLTEVLENFAGFEPGILLDGNRFDIRDLRPISHCAVVSDSPLIGPLTRMVGLVVSVQARIFPLTELTAAREWIHNMSAKEQQHGKALP